eukprot:1401782-Prymnesium_polylepis.2
MDLFDPCAKHTITNHLQRGLLATREWLSQQVKDTTPLHLDEGRLERQLEVLPLLELLLPPEKLCANPRHQSVELRRVFAALCPVHAECLARASLTVGK